MTSPLLMVKVNRFLYKLESCDLITMGKTSTPVICKTFDIISKALLLRGPVLSPDMSVLANTRVPYETSTLEHLLITLCCAAPLPLPPEMHH